LDVRNGKVLAYTEENALSLISTDAELVEQFGALKKKQSQQQLLLFIRRFNDRNPLYFPE
jgi:hypothetical protein